MFDAVPSVASDEQDPDVIETQLSCPRPGMALLTVAGEVDTLTATCLHDALTRLIGQAESALVVDLDGVTFLASSGLAVLIQAAHRAAATDRRLALVVQNRSVLRPLQITGTDRLFDVHPELGPALLPNRDV